MIDKIFAVIVRVISTIIVIPFIILAWAMLGVVYLIAFLCMLLSAVFCTIWGIDTGESIYD